MQDCYGKSGARRILQVYWWVTYQKVNLIRSDRENEGNKNTHLKLETIVVLLHKDSSRFPEIKRVHDFTTFVQNTVVAAKRDHG